jgi:hypothetical protein
MQFLGSATVASRRALARERLASMSAATLLVLRTSVASSEGQRMRVVWASRASGERRASKPLLDGERERWAKKTGFSMGKGVFFLFGALLAGERYVFARDGAARAARVRIALRVCPLVFAATSSTLVRGEDRGVAKRGWRGHGGILWCTAFRSTRRAIISDHPHPPNPSAPAKAQGS